MSKIKSQFEIAMKKKSVESFSEERKKEIKLKSLEEILSAIENRKNRFIFYCPDIAIVNPLAKLVYEVALEVKNAGHEVVMLHEINGYRAKWLFESEDYKEYRSLKTEYVINKVSGKSKRTKNVYSFKVSDTLVVTDAFQDMLEQLLGEEALNLVQKVVLVTGYMGLTSLSPGLDYHRLGVNSLVFFDDNIKRDYEELFTVNKNYILDSYPVSKGFRWNSVQNDKVYPVIAMTSIGNNEAAQQLMNIFYNRYPALNMFTFKVIGRENMSEFIEQIKTSAALVVLDKNVITKQMVYEVLSLGTPIILPQRREFLDNKLIVESFVVDADPFLMAEQIAEFCQHWLSMPNSEVSSGVIQVAKKLGLDTRRPEDFTEQVGAVFAELHNNRFETFTKLKESLLNDKRD